VSAQPISFTPSISQPQEDLEACKEALRQAGFEVKRPEEREGITLFGEGGLDLF
jgi:hypothetical protein